MPGRRAASPAVVREVVARLDELPDDDHGWERAVGLIAEAGELDALRSLLSERRSQAGRRALIDRLARAGDADAWAEALDRMLTATRAGESVPEPHFWTPVEDSRVARGLGALAHEQISRPTQDDEREWALGLLGAGRSLEALHELDALIAAHGAARPTLELTRATVARCLATDLVLERLPRDLAGAARLLPLPLRSS